MSGGHYCGGGRYLPAFRGPARSLYSINFGKFRVVSPPICLLYEEKPSRVADLEGFFSYCQPFRAWCRVQLPGRYSHTQRIPYRGQLVHCTTFPFSRILRKFVPTSALPPAHPLPPLIQYPRSLSGAPFRAAAPATRGGRARGGNRQGKRKSAPLWGAPKGGRAAAARPRPIPLPSHSPPAIS